MDKDLQKIKKLTALMKKQGILSVKLTNLEITLAPSALFPVELASPLEPTAEIPPTPTFTEEEILMWSSPGLMEETA